MDGPPDGDARPRVAVPLAAPDRRGPPPRGWLNRLAASRGFQAWAARMPLLNRIARAEGAALFDLIAGFVKSQALMALVELRLPDRLAQGPAHAADLAQAAGMTVDRMQILLQAGAAMGLLTRRRDGRFALARRGAAMLGVPGLDQMILHHRVLYDDLADPVAFLRGETAPGLARFWPYVFGAEGARDPAVAAAYSSLMADSQTLVAEDTLRVVDLSGVGLLMDVGGGTGAFLAAVGRAYPGLQLALFDLPAVVAGATARMAQAGMADRVEILPGSFRDDPLPQGADAISLVRVVYDHSDATVARLLAAIRAALPPGGLLIVSEPMSGGARPDPLTDTYFAFYTAAMQTGRTRSPAEIAALLQAAGFIDVVPHRAHRSFVTRVVTARTPKE